MLHQREASLSRTATHPAATLPLVTRDMNPRAESRSALNVTLANNDLHKLLIISLIGREGHLKGISAPIMSDYHPPESKATRRIRSERHTCWTFCSIPSGKCRTREPRS